METLLLYGSSATKVWQADWTNNVIFSGVFGGPKPLHTHDALTLQATADSLPLNVDIDVDDL